MTIKTTLIAAGALIAASLTAIPSANADNVSVQFAFGGGNGGYSGYSERYDGPRYERRFVSERRIYRTLRQNGFRNANVWRRGPVFVARAEDQRGRDYKIRLSAFDGSIIAVNRIGRERGRWH